MFQLSIQAACSYVRRVLDELVSVEDIGMLASPDAVDLHRMVEGFIEEAAVKVHNIAPSLMIDGVKAVAGEDYKAELKNGAIVITMLRDTIRMASIKVADSPYVVSDLIPEDSAEGRKQLNRYTRGVYDDPRVVLAKQWASDHRPVFIYYSTESNTVPEINLEYVPYPFLVESIVEVCPRLEYAVLNEVTAMVLDGVSEHDKAAMYRAKATAYLEGK